jgi:hypothetical protein
MGFKDLKSSQDDITTLQKKLADADSSKSSRSKDERFWQPTVDKIGNGFAVIRFLPAADGEDDPFVRVWDHGFQGPGGWYIENSLTTIGLNDPVGEFNSKLWNASKDDSSPQRKQARDQKRRLHYISNIIVLKDPGNPENEGKVFLFKYGKKIFDKLQEVMNPQFEDEKPMNPFSLWKGANFTIKIRKVDGYRSYDKSQFGEPSPLLEDDAKLEKIWLQCHKLYPFIDPNGVDPDGSKRFKPYAELKARLNKVLGNDGEATATTTSSPEATRASGSTTVKETVKSLPDDEEDEKLAWFKNLAGAGADE